MMIIYIYILAYWPFTSGSCRSHFSVSVWKLCVIGPVDCISQRVLQPTSTAKNNCEQTLQQLWPHSFHTRTLTKVGTLFAEEIRPRAFPAVTTECKVASWHWAHARLSLRSSATKALLDLLALCFRNIFYLACVVVTILRLLYIYIYVSWVLVSLFEDWGQVVVWRITIRQITPWTASALRVLPKHVLHNLFHRLHILGSFANLCTAAAHCFPQTVCFNVFQARQVVHHETLNSCSQPGPWPCSHIRLSIATQDVRRKRFCRLAANCGWLPAACLATSYHFKVDATHKSNAVTAREWWPNSRAAGRFRLSRPRKPTWPDLGVALFSIPSCFTI